MKIVNAACTFIFMFVGMVSFASQPLSKIESEKSLFHKNLSLKHDKIASLTLNSDEDIPIVNMQLSSLVKFSDQVTNKSFCDAVHIAVGFVCQNNMSKNSLDTIIKEATKFKIDIFEWLQSIEEVRPAIKFTSYGKSLANIDTNKIIVYDVVGNHNKQLFDIFSNNATKYENIDNINCLDYTIVYENFDYKQFQQQIYQLKTWNDYCFSMVIAQQRSSWATAVFKKTSGTIECILIEADKATEALIKKIISFCIKQDQFNIMIARFIIANYNSSIVQGQLAELRLDNLPLCQAFVKYNQESKSNEQTITTLNNKNTQLSQDLNSKKTELTKTNETLNKANAERDQLRKDYDNLKAKHVRGVAEQFFKFLSSAVKSIFGSAAGKVIAFPLAAWLFKKLVFKF